MRSLKEKKRDRVIKTIVLAMVLNISFAVPVFATDFTSTTLYTGTVNLLRGATIALTAITVVLTTFFSIKAGIAWQTAEEHDKNQKKKELINTIAIGVIVACISGLVTLILGAYGLTDGSGSGTAALETTNQFVQGIYHYKFM